MKRRAYEPDLRQWDLQKVYDLHKFVDQQLDRLKREYDEVAESIADMAAKTVISAASEALKYAMEDDDTYFYFPIQWAETGEDGIGGPPITDPLTMYLTVALSSEDLVRYPTYEFNLRSCVEAMCGCGKGGRLLISAALRQLADEIDSKKFDEDEECE